MILAIDPGTEQSGWVLIDNEPTTKGISVLDKGVTDNEEVARNMQRWKPETVVIEMISSYGMAVGWTTFETCVWIGRFIETARITSSDVFRIYRGDVKLHLCNSVRAKDANVWQAVVDRYGGKEMAIGKKASPGPLYGITSHVRQAMALAITHRDGVRSMNAKGEEI